ncbi:DUF421 domain-containing protein [Iamia majanohamensis]|uniref:DUF421 domain-containing protein n=1 Tax=Iamia majanohamensis TaxID=467976 RepID=A0AAF0BX97_9ACTN|nr:YetF domain-containing protein [Iamia majanohamensis]WCO68830.1 DUF421 domain-containing protein [Iamia majanohamensis]
METWFGAAWTTIGFVAGGTLAIYASTVVAVRLAGRRTVAQMSAYDAVVTIALGSVLATTAVSKDVSYAVGATAIVTLLVLQVGLAFVRRRFPRLRRLLEFAPEVVVEDGEVHLPTGPSTSQMTLDELRSQLRKQGVVDESSPALVLLEPDGRISVLSDADPAAALGRH